jgi:peptidoglycan/xylan/chitin deacetylase (PgdA/CDA1 family)
LPSEGLSDEVPAAPEAIDLDDLEQLAIVMSDGSIRLEDGRATVTYGGLSTSIFTLQDRMAQGDLDGDGDEDVVAHVIERSAGSGVFHYLVPVINEAGAAVARSPILVGDRIVMDSISVHDGQIEASLFDRGPDEPLTIISRHRMLEIDVSGQTPVVTVIVTQSIEDEPLPGPERPAIDIRFDPEAVSAVQPGSIEFRERQTYTVQASEGQPFTAVLEAPLGVWLDVRLDDLAVTPASQWTQLVTTELPASGPWQVTVVSSHAGPVDYELAIEVLPVEEASPPPTTTVQRVSPPRPATPDDEGNVVYLTFDDGPHKEYTPQVLDVLARYDARATFFVVGRLARAYPDIIQRIAAEGHTIANHTWNHEDLATLTRADFDDTVGRTEAILGDLATPCLRPPYGSVGAHTREWAAAHGLRILTWDASPLDWTRPPAEEIADYLVRWAQPGTVILLHDGGGNRVNTVIGLERALQRMADSDLRFEPVCR